MCKHFIGLSIEQLCPLNRKIVGFKCIFFICVGAVFELEWCAMWLLKDVNKLTKKKSMFDFVVVKY